MFFRVGLLHRGDVCAGSLLGCGVTNAPAWPVNMPIQSHDLLKLKSEHLMLIYCQLAPKLVHPFEGKFWQIVNLISKRWISFTVPPKRPVAFTFFMDVHVIRALSCTRSDIPPRQLRDLDPKLLGFGVHFCSSSRCSRSISAAIRAPAFTKSRILVDGFQ